MSINKMVNSVIENTELGSLELSLNLLANAVIRMKAMIPSFYLGNTKTLPLTTEFHKQMETIPDNTFKHMIDLSLISESDVKLMLEHFHELDDTVKETFTLFMRLTKRDQPLVFENYKRWIPDQSLFINIDSVNVASVKTERSLVGWDRKTMPYLHDSDLRATCMQFSELNSDYRNLFIEYINRFIVQCPEEKSKLNKYLRRRDPEHPLLKITSLSKPEFATVKALRNKLEDWDVSTVPYFSEATLQDIAINYNKWLIEERKCFLKYITMLNEVSPKQVHRLKQHLQISNPSNPLLTLSPLTDIPSTKNITKQDNKIDPIHERKGSKEHCSKLETEKNELMDIGDSNLENSNVKSNRFGTNASVPQNKIKLNLKSSLKNSKSKNYNFPAKLTAPQHIIDVTIETDTNQSIIDLEQSVVEKPLLQNCASPETFNGYLSLEQNELNIYNDTSNQDTDVTYYNNFTLDDFL